MLRSSVLSSIVSSSSLLAVALSASTLSSSCATNNRTGRDAGTAEGEGEGEGEGHEGEGEGEAPQPTGPQTVLLIGNSQLGYFGGSPQPPDVTVALGDLSRVFVEGRSALVVDRYSQAGTGCEGFWSAGDGEGSARALAASGYDVVVLLPSINEGDRAANEACWERFRGVAENGGSRFAVMATAHVSGAYPAGFDALDGAVRSYTKDNGLLFIPAGATWRRHLGEAPSRDDLLELYGADFAHPGPEGSYLYVLALYGALTNRSVVGVDNDIPALRCFPNEPCLTEAEMRACLNDRGEWGCQASNGAVFSNGRVSFVDDDEAAHYQQIVDTVLSER